MIKPLSIVNENNVQMISVPEDLRGKITTFAYCYLQELGFFNAVPSDEQGYTPWYTYPAISFLKDILKLEHKVLEYGSGYSTLFFKDKVQELTTVEHDSMWAQKIVDINSDIDIYVVQENATPHPDAMPKILEFINTIEQVRSNDRNHDLVHGLVNNEFAGYASVIYSKPKGYYDIVVIDGMARLLTGYLAADCIADDGYIILDNSDRWHYNNLQQYLFDKGYGRIDFWGPGHGLYNCWCTSFFSKNFKFNNNKKLREVTQGLITL
jgi:hypothetical protein